jgi:hypothetical protein
MISGDRQAGKLIQVCFPETDAIHHDTVIGREWSVCPQFTGEDAAMGLRKQDFLPSQIGKVGQGDRFRSGWGNERIHDLLSLHKE